MESERLRSGWVWIVAFAILLFGSTAVVGVWEAVDTTDSVPDFETNVSAAQAELSGFDGVRETLIERDGETVRTVERILRRSETGQYRIETVRGTNSSSGIKVSDGETLWLYDEAEGRAVRIGLGNRSASDRSDRIEQLLAIVGDDGTARTGAVSPLPVVPTEGGRAASTAGVAGSLTVNYEGTASVADRSTYVFELTSNANTSAFVSDFSQQLWLDQEWYVPLKRSTEFRRGERNVSITVGYRNITFNPAFDAGTFAFEPPTNVTVVEADRPRQKYFADRAGLRAASSYTLPDPSLPESFRLVEASRTVGDRVRSIGLQYANETARVTISKSNLTWYEPKTNGDPVAIAGQNATLRNLGTELRISWVCEGARYSVGASGVAEDELIAIARSIACE